MKFISNSFRGGKICFKLHPSVNLLDYDSATELILLVVGGFTLPLVLLQHLTQTLHRTV